MYSQVSKQIDDMKLFNGVAKCASVIMGSGQNEQASLLANEKLPVKNILVAVDSCEATTIESSIIRKTLELANAFSGKVWILHVVPPSRQPPFNVDTATLRSAVAAEYQHEHEFLQQLAQCLRDRQIDATALLVQGAIVKTILKESDRLDIDLIVLGCQKHGLLYGAILDNTEDNLLSKCPRPVMFIPLTE